MKVPRRTALRRVASLVAVMVVATLAVMGVTSTVALAADEAESMSHYEATTAEGIKVMVDAPEGALPEDATLNASLISDEGEKDSVASELDDAAVAYDGFMALDVSFTNAAGEEIEPSAAVNVRFEVPQGMLPEGAADLSVHHLAENEDGTVADVEAVADAAEKTDGTVTLADDNTLDAEFQVESFSSFVISWSDERSTYFRVTVNYVDADGKSIGETQSKEVSIKNDYTVSFSDYAGNIDGYTFSAAHYGAVDGSEVASMTATKGKTEGYLGNEIDQYRLTFRDSAGEQVKQLTYDDHVIVGDETQTADIYLVYDEVVEPGISIEDTVVTDGLFTATPTGGLELPTEGVTYQWERSLDGSTDWENVDRELVTGSHYNLENDGKSVNVAYDSIPAGAANNQRYWYRVTATVTNADGTETTYTSDALQVPYYIELQNGSFETPRNVSLTNQIVNGSQGVIWKTTGEGTGSHQGHDIEIVHPSYPGSMSNYHIDHTADGAQFAELNCEAYGALYQDVLTVPGAELNWYLSHAGREGVDKMALVIAPVDVAEEIAAELEDASRLPENQAPQAIQRILDEYAKRGFVKYFESDKGDWSNYEGTYTVPDGQYVTRFFFVAVDTASNDSSVGNLIDYVGFGSHPRPPEQDEGLLAIRKVVKGFQPDAAGAADYSVTVHVQGDGINREIVLTNFTTNEDGDWVAQGSVTVENMDPGTSQDVTVSELVSNAPENYTETSAATSTDSDVQQGEDSKSLSNVTIKAGDETGTTITFTNTYEEKASYGIYLYKGAALEQGDKVIADSSHPLQNAKFTVTDSEGELVAEGATGPDGHVALGGNLSAGTYTIRETSVPAGYQLLGYDITLVINSDGSAMFQMGNGEPQPAETVTEEGEYQGYFKLSLANYEADMTIPSTGGNGNTPLYVLGAAAVAGSVVMARRRFSSR